MKLSTIFEDNIEILWKLAEYSTRTYGISVVFEDLDGMRITQIKPDEKEDQFIRKYIICDTCKEIYKERNLMGIRHCNISDRDHSWQALAMRLQVPFLFECWAGISNFLIPIVIGGSVVGNVFGGQFFIRRDGASSESGKQNVASKEWTDKMVELVKAQWNNDGELWWDEVGDNLEYQTCLKEFLLGPESGEYPSKTEFIEAVNMELRPASGKENVIPVSFATEYDRYMYGVNRWDLIKRLIEECFREPKALYDILESLEENGQKSAPEPTKESVGSFLDSLSKKLAEEYVFKTEIMKAHSRQKFLEGYKRDIDKYEKEENRRAKSLSFILDVVRKLYYEARALSQLGNERYYLKLYEGISSKIPEFVENSRRRELEWIRKMVRKLVTEKPTDISEYQGKIFELNRRFYSVLTGFEKYQREYTGEVLRKLGELMIIRKKKTGSPQENRFYQFLTYYEDGTEIMGNVGEDIDLCERVYLASIYKLGRMKEEIDDLERVMRAQEVTIANIEERREKVRRSLQAWVADELKGEKKGQLSELDQRKKQLKSEKEGIEKRFAQMSIKRRKLDLRKENLFQEIYTCKKAYEDLGNLLDGIYNKINPKLEKIWKKLDEESAREEKEVKRNRVADSFDKMARVLNEDSDIPEILKIQELQQKCGTLEQRNELMKKELSFAKDTSSAEAELAKLRKREKELTTHNNNVKGETENPSLAKEISRIEAELVGLRELETELATLEGIEKRNDMVSIGIIGVKERRIDRLVWLNDTMARLMNLLHKKGFHVRYDTIYFNAGGLAPVHTDIELEQQKWMIERDETGPVSDKTEKRIERELKITRKYLSLLLGVKEHELVLTDSTTEGIFLTLNAINFQSGDQVITTEDEHDVVRYLLTKLEEKHKAHNIDLQITPYKIDKIVGQVTSATRLVLLSDILFTTGIRLPSKKIIEECRKQWTKKVEENEEKPENEKFHKSDGILFLVDGAQSAGQIQVDLDDLGCDFFAMDGHKWLLASEGSGALFVKEKYLEREDETVDFTFIKNYMVTDWGEDEEPSQSTEKQGRRYHPRDLKNDRAYELATINLASKIGLKAAIQMIARDGLISMAGQVFQNLSMDDRNAIALKILNDAFSLETGNVKDIDVELPKDLDMRYFEGTILGKFLTVVDENGKSHLTTKDSDTSRFLAKCLEIEIEQTKRKIDKLKDYFHTRLASFKKYLRIVTDETNEGGVVGFQLVKRSNNNEEALPFKTHEELRKKLQEDYSIIFRAIPPPFDPAFRVCLHKYNTTTEIDLFCYALQQTIPTVIGHY